MRLRPTQLQAVAAACTNSKTHEKTAKSNLDLLLLLTLVVVVLLLLSLQAEVCDAISVSELGCFWTNGLISDVECMIETSERAW